MTLILNEIYLLDGFRETFISSCADRRLLFEEDDETKIRVGKKLFEIPYLNATVSYWGYSYVRSRRNWELLSDWLPTFINKQHEVPDLFTFASLLREELNRCTSESNLKKYSSGFHLAGYNKIGIPEFIHFSNANLNEVGQYVNMRPQFKPPFADFLANDAKKYGWDGNNPDSLNAKGIVKIYRNGDFRLHQAAWKSLDKVFKDIFNFNDFKRPNYSNDKEIKQLLQYKLRFIAGVAPYTRWQKAGGRLAPRPNVFIV